MSKTVRAAFFGLAVSALQLLAAMFLPETGVLNWLRWAALASMAPGVLVDYIIVMGNIHDGNPLIVLPVSAAFYALLAWFLMRRAERRNAPIRQQQDGELPAAQH